MGNAVACLKKGHGALDQMKRDTTNEEEKFNELAKAVKAPQNEENVWIYFKYTWLPSVDDVIWKAQRTVNELHTLRYDLIRAMSTLMEKTSIWLIPGANTSHAILAVIYAISAQTKGAATEKFLTFGGKFPWFKVGKDSAELNIAGDCKILFDYFHALEKASQDMPKIAEDLIELSKKTVDLKDRAKGDLERVDKFKLNKCTSALTHNIKMLKRVKNLAKVTMKLVTKSASELEQAYNVIQEENTRLPEFGKILADEGLKDPKDCYLRVGQKIEHPLYTLTKEEMLSFPYDKKDKNDKSESKDEESDDDKDNE